VRRNKKRTLVAAIGVGALVLAGAAAYTNSLTDSTATNAPAAYGAVHATGATVTSISYTLTNANPAVVSAVTFVTTGDTSGSTAQVGFNGSGTMNVTGCTGTYDGSASTTYACTLTTTELVSAITETDIAVAPGA
jgi:predicted nucleotidyltransferase